jgi:hypothetical protein
MFTFNCTLDQFKTAISDFIKAAPECDKDSLESGYKAACLMYAGLDGQDMMQPYVAPGAMQLATKAYLKRDFELAMTVEV